MKKFSTCLYLRLSKEDEYSNESESITNQKALLTEFVNRQDDLDLIEVFVDELAIIRLNLRNLELSRGLNKSYFFIFKFFYKGVDFYE